MNSNRLNNNNSQGNICNKKSKTKLENNKNNNSNSNRKMLEEK